MDAIKDQFKKVLQFSQGVNNPQVDELFNQWQQNKAEFIQLFNGNLIYEVPEPITFALSQDGKDKGLTSFARMIEDEYDFSLLKGINEFFWLMESYEFYTNLTDKVYSIPYYDDNGDLCEVNIPKGMKVLKALKLFPVSEDLIKEIQQKASMVMQRDKVKGTLCFSVHPLDYLSISENTLNWRSCHALDGDYRTGNLNYMADSTTIVCYLKTDKSTILPHFPEDVPWNNKKWRVLLFLSNNRELLFAGRPYPFFSLEGLYQVLHYFNQLYSDKNHWTPKWEKAPADQIKVIKDKQHTFQYNDLLRSSFYWPMYTQCVRQVDADTRVEVGEPVKCIKCGEELINSCSNMQCYWCNGRYHKITDMSEITIHADLASADAWRNIIKGGKQDG